MPRGERHQVWYPELVALLRGEWRPDLSWEATVELRGQLQGHLEQLRARRGILPAVIHCPCCGTTAPAASPLISVRAMLLAVGRYGIETHKVLRQRERAWAGIACSMTWTLSVGGWLTTDRSTITWKGTKVAGLVVLSGTSSKSDEAG